MGRRRGTSRLKVLHCRRLVRNPNSEFSAAHLDAAMGSPQPLLVAAVSSTTARSGACYAQKRAKWGAGS
jgi:hypothetical protein